MIKKTILPIIVLSQFACTSLWFAGNSVMSDLVYNFQLPESALAHLTSSVQFGFIAGTLVFALLAIADRFSPSRVFFWSAIAGALFNLGTIIEYNNLSSLLTLRFFTGFFLAGIYPVGMKIAADYFQKGLGKSLGLLVGALVLGTAFPHLLKAFTTSFPWRIVLIITSALAISGGTLLLILVPDGPYRTAGQKIDLRAFFKIFRDGKFRSAAFGYFGHMWELYAFWAFIPLVLSNFEKANPGQSINISFWSFLIIGVGGLSCMLGGYIAQSFGTKRTATLALFLSGLCCLFSPLVFTTQSLFVLLVFLLFWGMMVTADSPLFSTLVAKNAAPEIKGSALTIVNCIGFSITIFSIQLLNSFQETIDLKYIYLVLALGPLFGLFALLKKEKTLEQS